MIGEEKDERGDRTPEPEGFDHYLERVIEGVKMGEVELLLGLTNVLINCD